MSADGPDPSADFGRGRSIIDNASGEYAEVVAGALKVTSTGGGGSSDQGAPNTPANAWPVKPTDAAGVNQQAITVDGDAKVTLDNEQPLVKIVSGDGSGNVATVDGSGNVKVNGTVSVPGVAQDATLTNSTQKTRIVGDTGINQAKVTVAGNVQVALQASSTIVSVIGTVSDDNLSGLLAVNSNPARANAAAPTWTETARVPLSVNLSGALRDDPVDRPARDMGKIDIASLDQYTPVSGRLPVDGSGVTQPVSDASGSLTVDAPVGTPVATRLSDGAAFYDGAKTGQLPAALVGGRLDTNLGAIGNTAIATDKGVSGAGVQRVIVSEELQYRAATANNVVAAASAASFFVIAGSASKTIRVRKLRVSGATLTALAELSVEVKKWSTALTAGTATALTKVPLDSNDAAATANLCQVYTAAPTDGTLVGRVGCVRQFAKATTAAEGARSEDISWDFGPRGVVLRGTAQTLTLAFGAAPATAVTLAVEVEWSEE